MLVKFKNVEMPKEPGMTPVEYLFTRIAKLHDEMAHCMGLLASELKHCGNPAGLFSQRCEKVMQTELDSLLAEMAQAHQTH